MLDLNCSLHCSHSPKMLNEIFHSISESQTTSDLRSATEKFSKVPKLIIGSVPCAQVKLGYVEVVRNACRKCVMRDARQFPYPSCSCYMS